MFSYDSLPDIATETALTELEDTPLECDLDGDIAQANSYLVPRRFQRRSSAPPDPPDSHEDLFLGAPLECDLDDHVTSDSYLASRRFQRRSSAPAHLPTPLADDAHAAKPPDQVREALTQIIETEFKQFLPTLIEFEQLSYNLQLDEQKLATLQKKLAAYTPTPELQCLNLEPASDFINEVTGLDIDKLKKASEGKAPEQQRKRTRLILILRLVDQLYLALNSVESASQLGDIAWSEEMNQREREMCKAIAVEMGDKPPAEPDHATTSGKGEPYSALRLEVIEVLQGKIYESTLPQHKLKQLMRSKNAEDKAHRTNLAAQMGRTADQLSENANSIGIKAKQQLLVLDEPTETAVRKAIPPDFGLAMHTSLTYTAYNCGNATNSQEISRLTQQRNPMIKAAQEVAERQSTNQDEVLTKAIIAACGTLERIASYLRRKSQLTAPPEKEGSAPTAAWYQAPIDWIKPKVASCAKESLPEFKLLAEKTTHTIAHEVRKQCVKLSRKFSSLQLSKAAEVAIANGGLRLLDEIRHFKWRIELLPQYIWMVQEAADQIAALTNYNTTGGAGVIGEQQLDNRLGQELARWKAIQQQHADKLKAWLQPLTRLTNKDGLRDYTLMLDTDFHNELVKQGASTGAAAKDYRKIEEYLLSKLQPIAHEVGGSIERLASHGHSTDKELQIKIRNYTQTLRELDHKVRLRLNELTKAEFSKFKHDEMLVRGIAEWAQPLKQAFDNTPAQGAQPRPDAAGLFETCLLSVIEKSDALFTQCSDLEKRMFTKRLTLALEHVADNTLIYPRTAEEIMRNNRTLMERIERLMPSRMVKGALSLIIYHTIAGVIGWPSLLTSVALETIIKRYVLTKKLEKLRYVRVGDIPAYHAEDTIINCTWQEAGAKIATLFFPAISAAGATLYISHRLATDEQYQEALLKRTIEVTLRKLLFMGLYKLGAVTLAPSPNTTAPQTAKAPANASSESSPQATALQAGKSSLNTPDGVVQHDEHVPQIDVPTPGDADTEIIISESLANKIISELLANAIDYEGDDGLDKYDDILHVRAMLNDAFADDPERRVKLKAIMQSAANDATFTNASGVSQLSPMGYFSLLMSKLTHEISTTEDSQLRTGYEKALVFLHNKLDQSASEVTAPSPTFATAITDDQPSEEGALSSSSARRTSLTEIAEHQPQTSSHATMHKRSVTAAKKSATEEFAEQKQHPRTSDADQDQTQQDRVPFAYFQDEPAHGDPLQLNAFLQKSFPDNSQGRANLKQHIKQTALVKAELDKSLNKVVSLPIFREALKEKLNNQLQVEKDPSLRTGYKKALDSVDELALTEENNSRTSGDFIAFADFENPTANLKRLYCSANVRKECSEISLAAAEAVQQIDDETGKPVVHELEYLMKYAQLLTLRLPTVEDPEESARLKETLSRVNEKIKSYETKYPQAVDKYFVGLKKLHEEEKKGKLFSNNLNYISSQPGTPSRLKTDLDEYGKSQPTLEKIAKASQQFPILDPHKTLTNFLDEQKKIAGVAEQDKDKITLDTEITVKFTKVKGFMSAYCEVEEKTFTLKDLITNRIQNKGGDSVTEDVFYKAPVSGKLIQLLRRPGKFDEYVKAKMADLQKDPNIKNDINLLLETNRTLTLGNLLGTLDLADAKNKIAAETLRAYDRGQTTPKCIRLNGEERKEDLPSVQFLPHPQQPNCGIFLSLNGDGNYFVVNPPGLAKVQYDADTPPTGD